MRLPAACPAYSRHGWVAEIVTIAMASCWRCCRPRHLRAPTDLCLDCIEELRELSPL